MGTVSNSKNIQHRNALHRCIPRSPEVTAIAVLCVGGIALGVTYPSLLEGITEMAAQAWDIEERDLRKLHSSDNALSTVALIHWLPCTGMILGIGAVMGLAAWVVSVFQGGMTWDWNGIAANWDRVYPGGYGARTWNLDRQLAIGSSFLSGIGGLCAACWLAGAIYTEIFIPAGVQFQASSLPTGILGKVSLGLFLGALAMAAVFSTIRTFLAFRRAEAGRQEEQIEQETRRVKYRRS
jgi:flagellar biosynthesis protein FlhB